MTEERRQKLGEVIFQTALGSAVVMGVMGLAGLFAPRVGAFCERYYGRCEPQIRSVESAWSSAAMLSFGIWDPDYEPYKPDRNSNE